MAMGALGRQGDEPDARWQDPAPGDGRAMSGRLAHVLEPSSMDCRKSRIVRELPRPSEKGGRGGRVHSKHINEGTA